MIPNHCPNNWGKPTTNYTPNGLNQYTAVGGQSLSYSNNFNLSAYAGASYSYDADNRLLNASKGGNTLVCVYDGLGRCLKRTQNGVVTIYTYDGWKPIAEWDGAGTLVAWNIYGSGPDEILYRYSATYGVVRYHRDIHGNVMFLLDLNGNGIEKYSYDAFGKPTITDWSGNVRTTSACGNRFMFTGREYFPALGIYDYRHRAYQPELGRFLQADPIGLQTQGEKLSPQQTALYPKGEAPGAFADSEMNLFRYGADDPINHTDPTGLIWVVPTELAKDFAAARRYASQDKAVGKIFDAIDKSNVKVIVSRSDSKTQNRHVFRGDTSKGTFEFAWNPDAAVRTKTDGSISPALVLAHEAAHAERFTRDAVGMQRDSQPGSDRKYGTIEEKRAFGIENHAATILTRAGHAEGVRTTGAGDPVPVGCVTCGGSQY